MKVFGMSFIKITFLSSLTSFHLYFKNILLHFACLIISFSYHLFDIFCLIGPIIFIYIVQNFFFSNKLFSVYKIYQIANTRPLLQATQRVLLRNIFEHNKFVVTKHSSSGSNFLLASTSAITQDKLDKWRKEFYSCPKNILAQNVCSRFDPMDVCLSRQQLECTNHVFTYKVRMIIYNKNHLMILMYFYLGGNGRQTSDKPKKLRQMLVICSLELHTFAFYERA